MGRTRDERSGGHGDEGFTLIELLIVVMVLGVLSGVVVFALTGVHAKAYESTCEADTRAVETAQQARRTVRGTFAPDLPSLVPEFIRSTPRNTDHYVITTDISGTVYVTAAGGSPQPVNGQPNPCRSIT